MTTSPHRSWGDVGLHLMLAVPFQEWREAPWLRVVICKDGEPGRIQAYRLVEAPHAVELELAVKRWLETGELATLEHPASYLLAVRFAAVGHLLSTFDVVLPLPPEHRIRDVYEDFLLSWWREKGAHYAVGFSCCEYDIEADV